MFNFSNIRPSKAIEEGMKKLASSRTFQGPDRSLGIDLGELEKPPPRKDELKFFADEMVDVSSEPPAVVSANFNFPSQRPSAQEQAESMLIQGQRNDTRLREQQAQQAQRTFQQPQPPSSGFSAPQQREQIRRQQQIEERRLQEQEEQRRREEQQDLIRRQEEYQEFLRLEQEKEIQRQKEEIAKRQREQEIIEKNQQIHNRLPQFLYVVLGNYVIKLEKHPTNFFEYWVDRTGNRGVARLLGDNPLRVVWISRDKIDFTKSSIMFANETIPVNERPVFKAFIEMPQQREIVQVKPKQPEMEMETKKEIFSMEEKERLLSKAPVIFSKRERESSPDDVQVEISIAPSLKEQEKDLLSKRQRLQVLDQRLRDPILMQRDYEDVKTQLQILQEQIRIQSDLVNEMRQQWKQQKQLIANEKVRAYREQMQKEVDREDDNERLVDAINDLKRITQEAVKVEKEMDLREPKKLSKRYRNELTDLKQEVSLLEKNQTKLEKLKEIEEIANIIFRTSQKRTFTEFKVHFPKEFAEYMTQKGAPVRLGKLKNFKFDQLTRDEQVEALKIYLCGENKVLDIHEPGYVEEVLNLDNKYCEINIIMK